jgi:5-methylcytosine-specific restriction endonuclease McrA
MKTKTCPQCQKEKSCTEFPKDRTRKDGFYPICRECHNRKFRERYQADEELRKRKYEKAKESLLDPKKREKRNSSVLKWRHKKFLESPEYKEEYRRKSKLFEQRPERKAKKQIYEKQRKRGDYNRTVSTPRTRERYNSDPEYHDRVRIQKNARIQRTRTNGGSFTEDDWKYLVTLADGKCLCCGRKIKLTMDHIVPVIAGGKTDINNIQPLCISCNSSKGDKHIDYRPSEFKLTLSPHNQS